MRITTPHLRLLHTEVQKYYIIYLLICKYFLKPIFYGMFSLLILELLIVILSRNNLALPFSPARAKS